MLKALSFTDSLRAKNSTSDKKLSQLKLKIIKLEQQVGHLRLELKARNKEVSELKNSSSQNRSHGDSRLNHQLQKELYESERCRDVDNRIATAAKAQLHDMRSIVVSRDRRGLGMCMCGGRGGHGHRRGCKHGPQRG